MKKIVVLLCAIVGIFAMSINSSFHFDYELKKLVQLDSYGNRKILKEDFDVLPILLRINVVHEIIGETHLSWRRFQYEGLKKFLIQSRTGQSLSLPMNWRILRDRNKFLLRKDQEVQKLSHKVQPADITDCGNFYFH
jgi:hypothetical protein